MKINHQVFRFGPAGLACGNIGQCIIWVFNRSAVWDNWISGVRLELK